MGRFDALTQLEDLTNTPTPPPVAPPPTKNQDEPKQIPKAKPVKKPEFMKTRKPENYSQTDQGMEKPEKYYTLLQADLIKKIKMFAAEQDIKDYKVIELALTEYFDKHK